MKKHTKTTCSSPDITEIDYQEEEFEDIWPDLFHASRKTLLRRGIIFLIFGLLLFFKPVPSITIAVIVAGFYITIEGASILMQALYLPYRTRTIVIINAVILLLSGIASIAFPWIMGEYAVIFFGAWQLISGVECFFLMRVPGHRIKTFFTGFFCVISGLLFILAPLLGLLAMSWLFAILFIASGILMLFTAITMKNAVADANDDEPTTAL